jgi:hypothetical protein
MELIRREMPANYELIDAGDLHALVANTNEDGIREMIAYVKQKPRSRFLWLKGDLIDAITYRDKRFSLKCFKYKEVTTPQEQADWMLEVLRPIAKQILGIQLGNHEMELFPVIDFLKYWCDNLDVPWAGYAAKFVHLKDGEPQWKAYLTHGNGSLRSKAKDPIQRLANQKASLKDKLKDLTSDCIYMSMGHTHNMLLVKPTIQNHLHIIDDGEKLQQVYRVDTDQKSSHINPEARWYGCNGSFLSTFSQPGEGVIPYSERAMYPPQQHGYLKLTIKNHRLEWVERCVV